MSSPSLVSCHVGHADEDEGNYRAIMHLEKEMPMVQMAVGMKTKAETEAEALAL